MQNPDANPGDVKVWDPLVRVFHWALVLAFTVAYLSGDELMGVHVIAGYTIAGLIAFRLLWGLVGPRHARFSDFVRSPSTVWSYLRDVLWRRAKRYLGHNPAGGAMILALLLMLVLTALSGMSLYAVHDGAGPLAPWLGGVGHGWEETLEELHEFAANFTLFLVGLHVFGVVVESLLHGENLARSMVTGRKRAL